MVGTGSSSEFIRERQFLTNVFPSTLEWYKHSFKWLDTESPTQEAPCLHCLVNRRCASLRIRCCS